MAIFNKSFEKLMKWEGWSIDSVTGDMGGNTCCGISYEYNKSWRGWKILEDNNNKLDENVRNAVADYYRIEYCRIRMDEIKVQKIADQIFQAFINCGRIALAWAQAIVGVDVDSFIGEISIHAINNYNEKIFIQKYYEKQVNYYRTIVKKNQSQEKFIVGWLKRAGDFI